MKRLVFDSSLLLLRFEVTMRFGGFSNLRDLVLNHEIHPQVLVPRQTVCCAMDYACVFYFKPVLCLQRSAATAILLRRHGWQAELVIGAQILPFRSHAWCEVDGVVVNDKPYVRDLYQVLERY